MQIIFDVFKGTWLLNLPNPWVRIIAAAVIIIIGEILVSLFIRAVKKVVNKRGLDKAIASFFISLMKITLNIALFIAAVAALGVETGSLIAIIGAGTVTVGLALKDSFSNIASGFIILYNRSFLRDDFIEVNGISGTVKRINIYNTELLTSDNKTVFIPNSAFTENNVINYTRQEKRRLDMEFSIDYTADLEKAKDIIKTAAESSALLVELPAPLIRALRIEKNSVIIAARFWVGVSSYWDLHFYMIETVKKEFHAQDIRIPFERVELIQNAGECK